MLRAFHLRVPVIKKCSTLLFVRVRSDKLKEGEYAHAKCWIEGARIEQ